MNYFINNTEAKDNKEAKDCLWKLLQTSENYLYLIWAWCSVNSWWKIMSTLWNILAWKEDKEWNLIIDSKWTTIKIDNFEDLKKKAWYLSWENLEELLTRIKITESYFESFGDSKKDEKEEMKNFREEIEKQLKKHCKDDIIIRVESKHLELISKITNWRKLSLPRTKIFTLNYDTLFENAWNKLNYTIIDWFSFSLPRTFNWTNFDLDIVKRNKNYLEKEDNFEKKVFHLYKLHGSINWDEDKDWIITQIDNAKWKLIYPWSSKYEESYDMPYFEMISRFQQELRKENVTLTIIWYSFSDNHINSMIKEAFKTNPSLNLVIVWKGNFEKKYEIWDDEKEYFLEKKDKDWVEYSYFSKIVINSVDILNEWLKQNRVFLFNMYFEPFVDLIPWKDVKTKEEEIAEKLVNLIS